MLTYHALATQALQHQQDLLREAAEARQGHAATRPPQEGRSGTILHLPRRPILALVAPAAAKPHRCD